VNAAIDRYVETRGAFIKERLLGLYRRKINDVLGSDAGPHPEKDLHELRRIFLRELGKFETLVSDELRADVSRHEDALGDRDARESVDHLLNARMRRIRQEFRSAADEEILRAHFARAMASPGPQARHEASGSLATA
jgi:hypothetical protein